MRKLLVVATVVLALGACRGPRGFNALAVGMSKERVYEKCGTPMDTAAQGATEILRYRGDPDDDERRPDLFVRLVDGRVESFGRMGDFDSTKVPERTLNLNVREE
jgi:hypothetical protein